MSSKTLSHPGGWIILFLISALPAAAAFSFQIDSSEPSSVSRPDEEVTVRLSLTDLPSASYFRAAFQQASGEPYFGYLKNNSGNWVKTKSLSSDCRDYFYLAATSSATLNLTLRVGEDQKVESGQHQLKAHRFTASSCSVSEAKNTRSISLNFSPPPATPSPTPAPTPTLTPSPRPTASPHPTSPFSPSPVLSASTEAQPPPQSEAPSPVPASAHPSPSLLPLLPISLGTALIGSSLWLFFRRSPA